MKKADLKTGMIIVTRKGDNCIVYKDTKAGDRYKIIGLNSFFRGDDFTDTLTHNCEVSLDIVKVYDMPSIYGIGTKGILLWERKEPKQLTVSEIEELQEKVFEQLQGVGIDYTYWNGNTITQGVTTRYFLTKEKFETIFKDVDLGESASNFLNQCYKQMHLNHCDGDKNAITKVEYIDFTDINTILCIRFGQKYLDIMKTPKNKGEKDEKKS